jgi:hypothetical protein
MDTTMRTTGGAAVSTSDWNSSDVSTIVATTIKAVVTTTLATLQVEMGFSLEYVVY